MINVFTNTINILNCFDHLFTNNLKILFFLIILNLILISSLFFLNNIKSNNSSYQASGGLNSPGGPPGGPKRPKNKKNKIKEHLNKYKMEYVLGGTVLLLTIGYCYYNDISITDILNLFKRPSSGGGEGGSSISSEGESFSNEELSRSADRLKDQKYDDLFFSINPEYKKMMNNLKTEFNIESSEDLKQNTVPSFENNSEEEIINAEKQYIYNTESDMNHYYMNYDKKIMSEMEDQLHKELAEKYSDGLHKKLSESYSDSSSNTSNTNIYINEKEEKELDKLMEVLSNYK